jgi:hypothetical protein
MHVAIEYVNLQLSGCNKTYCTSASLPSALFSLTIHLSTFFYDLESENILLIVSIACTSLHEALIGHSTDPSR